MPARLLRSWARIRPGAWMSVCCECCVLSGRGLCDELITRPEESYQLWCVIVCDLETTKILVNEEEAKAHQGAMAPKKIKLPTYTNPDVPTAYKVHTGHIQMGSHLVKFQPIVSHFQFFPLHQVPACFDLYLLFAG